MTQLLMTEAEAAERLSLCTRTLRKARQEGALPFVLIGRAVRYTMADLESYIEKQRQTAAPCQPSANVMRRPVKRHSAVIVPFTERTKR